MIMSTGDAGAVKSAISRGIIIAYSIPRRSRSRQRLANVRRRPEGIRYSALTQINRDNVSNLEVAWTFDTGDSGDRRLSRLLSMAALWRYRGHQAFALQAATGKLIWRFDSGIAGSGPNRGVTYWSHGRDKRIFAAVASFVYALDARTGKPIESLARGTHQLT